MKLNLALCASLALLGLGAVSCANTGTKAATNASMSCPTCGTKMETAATTRVWNGKTYGFCCGNCEASFTKNPEKYAK